MSDTPHDKTNRQRRTEIIDFLVNLTPEQLALTEKLVMAASKVQVQGGTEAEQLAAVQHAFERKDDPVKVAPVTLPADEVEDDERRAALVRLSWSLYGQLIHHSVLEVPNMYGGDMVKVAEHMRNVTNSIFLSLVGAGLEWSEIS